MSSIPYAGDGDRVHLPTRSADDELYRRISWRLIPLLFCCYIVNYLDRTNVGYAKLQMNDALAFSDTVFGLGAAMFFVGYALFEIPSNMLLLRVGIRQTLLRIMVLWGLASAATMWVQTPLQFYAVRFLVGVFEAGFTPGVLFYLTLWFPPDRRARANALFFMGYGAAPIVAGPLAGTVMTWMNGVLQLHGWQWLFLVEGLAAVALGVVAWRRLDDGPERASWLSAAEIERVRALVPQHNADASHHRGSTWAGALRLPRVWGMALVGFLIVQGIYAFAFWQPTLLQGTGLSVMQVGWVSVLPAIAGVACSLWLGRRSDLKGERRGHLAFSAVLGGTGLALTTMFPQDPVPAVACLALASAGVGAAFTIFWASPGAVLAPQHLAVGIALINTCIGFGGVLAPQLMALARTATGSFTVALYILAGALLLAALVFSAVLPRPRLASSPTTLEP